MDKNTLEQIAYCWSITPSGTFDYEKAERLIIENYVNEDLEDVLSTNGGLAERIQELELNLAAVKADNKYLQEKLAKVSEAEEARVESRIETIPVKDNGTGTVRGKRNERKGDTKPSTEE